MTFPMHFTRSEPIPPPAPAPEPPPPSASSTPIRSVDRGLARLLGLPLAHPGLSPSRVATLLVLDRLAAVTPGELAERAGVTPPSMTRSLTLLEERGLTARQPYPADPGSAGRIGVDHRSTIDSKTESRSTTRIGVDHRTFAVVLTDVGRAAVQAMHRDRDDRLAARLAGLSEEERAALAAAAPVLDKLLRLAH